MKNNILVTAVLGGIVGIATPTGASADQLIGSLSDGHAQVVDFSGKPPFRRTAIDASRLTAEERDRLEALDDAPRQRSLTATARVAGDRGRPPYRRDLDTSTDAQSGAARFARFEEQAAAVGRSGRRGPPGKRFPFRHR